MGLKIVVVYASRHGHVQTIAARLAAIAAMRGIDCTLLDVRARPFERLPAGCDAVIIAGAVHLGRHSRRLRRFVTRSLDAMKAVPSAFVSVSGSAIALEGRAKAEEYIAAFRAATGWQPDLTLSAAGAVPYTKYDPLTRLVMKFASRTAGRDTDTSRDFDYTNWTLVNAFMHHFVDIVERHVRAAAERSAGRAAAL